MDVTGTKDDDVFRSAVSGSLKQGGKWISSISTGRPARTRSCIN